MDWKNWKVTQKAARLPYFDEVLMPMLLIINKRGAIPNKSLQKWLIRYLKLQEVQVKLDSTNQLGLAFNQITKELADFSASYLLYAKLVQIDRFLLSNWCLWKGFEFLKNDPTTDGIKQMFKNEKELGQFANTENYIGIEKEIANINQKIDLLNSLLDKPQIIKQQDLRLNLDNKLTNFDPFEFEKIIVKILADIYKGEGALTRAVKDGGIDGLVRYKQGFSEHLLLIQVKKYKGTTIGVEAIRAFSAVVDKYLENIPKIGIFVTTSTYSNDAKKFVNLQAGNISIITIDELISEIILRKIGINENKGILNLNEEYYKI